MLPQLRDGLSTWLATQTEIIDQRLPCSGRAWHPEWFAPARLMFEEAFALIDLVGWATSVAQGDPQISVSRHGQRVKQALDSTLTSLADALEEADANDARRASEGLPPRKQEIIEHARAVCEFLTVIEQALDAAE